MPFGIIGRTGPGKRHVWGSVYGKGYFFGGGRISARHCNQWGLTFAATRSSSQITLGRLVIIIIIIVIIIIVIVIVINLTVNRPPTRQDTVVTGYVIISRQLLESDWCYTVRRVTCGNGNV